MWQEFHPGQRVMARDQPWRITGLKTWSDCVEVHLTGIAPSSGDEPHVLLLPFDRLQSLDTVRAVGARGSSTIRRASRQAWMRALAGAACGARPSCGLQAAQRASIDLLPWQIEPAMALASGAASRILVADAVGSGKTIQALAALAELKARGEAERVLIVTPAGLRDQWAGELTARFRQTCLVADAAFLAAAARELPPDVNPWSLAGVYVVSFDFLKRHEVLRGIDGLWWDLVIADEAHLAAPGTDRAAALGRAAGRAARVILLTATPYASDREGYSALLAIGSEPTATDDRDVIVFRRSRTTLWIGVPPRRTRLLAVRLTAEERRLHRLLDRYTFRVWRENSSAAARLAMIVLRKRALSSAWAAGRTIERRLTLLEQPGNRVDCQIALPFDPDEEGEASADDTVTDAIIGAPGLSDIRAERDILATLAAAAEACVCRESKIRSLKRLLARTSEAAIVFTEYRETLEHLARELSATRRHVLLHGGLSRDERRAACAALNDGSVSLLLATDAAGEGLNLHFACRWVINFELPWNPARLEQRVGRVDRYGQRRRPHVVHLVARDTAESIVLGRLEARLRRARQAGWFDDVWPAEPVVAARVVGGARLPDDERSQAPQGTTASAETASLAARACAEAVRIPLDQPKGWFHKKSGWFHKKSGWFHKKNTPLLLELTPARLARRRGGLDQLVAENGTLFIFKSVIADDAGRVVDSTIVAAKDQKTVEAWLSSRLRDVHQFRQTAADRLIQRWRAIGSANGPPRREVQPALFDRRAVESARAEEAARIALARDLRSRVERLERSRTLAAEPPELLLVARGRSDGRR